MRWAKWSTPFLADKRIQADEKAAKSRKGLAAFVCGENQGNTNIHHNGLNGTRWPQWKSKRPIVKKIKRSP
jgi:hypothetical protein